MDFFTADTHFGHFNIIKYTNRPFSDIDEMDDEIIWRWNSTVNPTDTVYHLGDFTLKGYEEFVWYVEKLHGNIKIVPGSHDHSWLAQFKPTPRVEILPPLYSLEYSRAGDYPKVIVLCHYALKTWDRSHYGSWHLFGHSHGKLKGEFNSLDVGVDQQNFYPVSLEELDEYFSLYGV